MRELFGPPLGMPIGDEPGERDFAVTDCHFDVARIDPWIVCQPLAEQLANAFIRSAITLWSATAMIWCAPLGNAAFARVNG